MTNASRAAIASIVASTLTLASFPSSSFAQQPAASRPPNGAGANGANAANGANGANGASSGQDPDNEQFARLLEAQKRYQGYAASGGWPALPDGDAMKPGEKVDCARLDALRKRLEVEGYRPRADAAAAPASPAGGGLDAKNASASPTNEAAPDKNATADKNPAAGAKQGTAGAKPGAATGCEYDAELAAAVKDFQHDRYLTRDGIVGGQTQRQLARPVEDVLSKIDYAIKRWRANAGTMKGSYIVVNIPAFELAVYEGARETLRMPVIVGLPDWETPELVDKVDAIVVNPPWNIPKSIAGDEVIPKSKKDPGYFKREGIVSADGRLTQKPGPRNPLGRLKFQMPNREDIYLHDTPHKQKFAASARAFSHGCVRVEKPLDLAVLLLKDDPKWSSREAIQSAIDTNETQTVKLATPMPVHLLYIPAVVGGDSRLQVAPDVYDRIGNASDEQKAMEPAPTEEGEFLGAWP